MKSVLVALTLSVVIGFYLIGESIRYQKDFNRTVLMAMVMDFKILLIMANTDLDRLRLTLKTVKLFSFILQMLWI